MSRGKRRTLATLSDIPSDSTPAVYSPSAIWIAPSPLGPGSSDENAKGFNVETDYNPQITTNTKLTLEDGRVLFVRGIQDVDDLHRTLLLYCEQVLNP